MDGKVYIWKHYVIFAILLCLKLFQNKSLKNTWLYREIISTYTHICRLAIYGSHNYEVEPSYDLLSINQKPRKVVGVIQFELEGLRTRGTDGIILILKSGRPKSQFKQSGREGKILLSFFLLFYSGPQWMGWRPPTLGRPSTLLSLPIQMPI